MDLLWRLTWARIKIIECFKSLSPATDLRWNYFKPMRTLVVVGGVGGNPPVKKNDLKIMSALKNGKICVDLIASA